MFKPVLEKAEETEIKLPTSTVYFRSSQILVLCSYPAVVLSLILVLIPVFPHLNPFCFSNIRKSYKLVAQSHPTLCKPMDCSPWLLCPWDSLGKNTGVGCHFLLQILGKKSFKEHSSPGSSLLLFTQKNKIRTPFYFIAISACCLCQQHGVIGIMLLIRIIVQNHDHRKFQLSRILIFPTITTYHN